MRKYRILSALIVFICVLFSLNMAIDISEKMQQVSDAENTLKAYKERMSSPVNALDPSASSIAMTNGQLIIPQLDVDCTIRSDTVNAYDSVYHYPESAAYGQPGECAILGHRTTYSGIFKNIGDLEPGDEVIVKDLILKKKYTYQVTFNGGDIRWDYKSNPIRFSLEGEKRLLLMTCYPPGEKSAAWITHCKLKSTSSF